LIWGVNDFDEACEIPYPVDLVRLAVSARLAISQGIAFCEPQKACTEILGGYAEAVERGGEPFELGERHRGLRDLALNELRDPARYWDRINRCPGANKLPPDVKNYLMRALLESPPLFRVVHRQAGLGSLGRWRFTLMAQWRGGFIAREAKELVPSAWHWNEENQGVKNFYAPVIARAVRVADPMVSVQQQWLIGRLAPDCSRIELNQLPKKRDELKLLHAMGFETANFHLGTKNAAKNIAADLRKRPSQWLCNAARAMEQATIVDWKLWRDTR
jgi:Uncharacterized protein conserved in bacteria (DUF2252)